MQTLVIDNHPDFPEREEWERTAAYDEEKDEVFLPPTIIGPEFIVIALAIVDGEPGVHSPVHNHTLVRAEWLKRLALTVRGAEVAAAIALIEKKVREWFAGAEVVQ